MDRISTRSQLYVTLFTLMVSGALLDVATTTYGLTYAERFVETNDMLLVWMDRYGVLVGHMLVKLLAITTISVLSLILPSHNWLAFVPPTVLWMFAGLWNFHLLISSSV